MPTSPVINVVLLLMLVIKTAFPGFTGPAGFGSVLLLLPFYLFLIPVSDSLLSEAGIRFWNKHKGRFEWIDKDDQPFQFWLAVLISWPAAAMFGYLFLVA